MVERRPLVVDARPRATDRPGSRGSGTRTCGCPGPGARDRRRRSGWCRRRRSSWKARAARRRVAAGAAPPDGHAAPVDLASASARYRAAATQSSTSTTPHWPCSSSAVGPPVAGAAAVVDVDHGEATAGPELDARAGAGVRAAPVGPPWLTTKQRRLLPVRPLEVRVRSAGSRGRRRSVHRALGNSIGSGAAISGATARGPGAAGRPRRGPHRVAEPRPSTATDLHDRRLAGE